MSYKIEIQNNFFVVTDTATGIEEVREVRDQVKWRVSGSIYSFFYNIPNLVDQNSPNIIRLGENAKEFDFSEIVDSTETPFASRAIFNDLLNVNLGFMIRETSSVWGLITGDINDQTDLQTILNGKFDVPTGDTTQYIAGDGTLITFPVSGQAGTLVREVRNTTGATLTKGTVVYINGANGNKPTVAKAQANAESTSARTFGLLQSNIANNSNGFVVVIGDLTGLDTSAIAEGTQLYLSSTVAGEYTTTKQVAPAHMVYVGKVTRSHPTLGQIEVYVQNGFELDELHDVSIVSKTDGQVLQFEGASGLWKNKTLATGLTVGTTAISSGTDGRVLFQSAGVLQQSANFFWDNTNSRLGIGQTSPTARLDILAQGALSSDSVFRIRNSANTLDILKIAGNGNLSYYTVGGGITLENYDGTTAIGSTGGSVTKVNLLSNTAKIYVNYDPTQRMRFESQSSGASGETAYRFNATIGSNTGTNYGKVINLLDARPDFGNRANTVIGLSIKKDATNTNTSLQFQAIETTSGRVSIGWASGTYSGALLDIRSAGALSTDIAFRVRNSANTADWFSVQGNGYTNVIALEASGFINIKQPAGQYYPNINLIANGSQNCGTFEGYNGGLYLKNATYFNIQPANVYIGAYNTGQASAVLTVNSTTKGFLPPRMTNAERTAIASPAVGLMVYCTDSVEGLYIYKSTGWTFVI